jgi:hypothetical protein
MRNTLPAFMILLLCLIGCRKNEALKPALPDTKIFVDKINLSGIHRLGTSVSMHWTGYSASGYITGYEFSFDQAHWFYTQKTDSTFLFTLQKGNDSSDIIIYIRAIDNYGQKDHSPASLVIPIKNAAPQAAFSKTKTLPDTVNSLFSIEWTLHDPDGDATVDSLFMKFNDGAWYPLNPQITFATFIPDNTSGTGKMNASVYKDILPVLLGQKISGININGLNKLYIRAKDNAGAFSSTDSTGTFYLRGKHSDLLLINDNSGLDPSGDLLRNSVSGVYGKYDYINFNRDNQKYAPLYWAPTLNFLLKQYDKVFIYSDGQRLNGKLMLENAAPALSDFLNNSGKLLISVILPFDLDTASALYSYSPVQSISKSTGQARFYQDSLAVHDATNAPGYMDLKNNSFILGFAPFYPKADAKIMYRAKITSIGGWKGPDIVCAKTINTKGKTNQVFWSLDLSIVDADMTALTDNLNKTLLHEFNW